jgi:hypothetical protein
VQPRCWWEVVEQQQKQQQQQQISDQQPGKPVAAAAAAAAEASPSYAVQLVTNRVSEPAPSSALDVHCPCICAIASAATVQQHDYILQVAAGAAAK